MDYSFKNAQVEVEKNFTKNEQMKAIEKVVTGNKEKEGAENV